VIDRAHREFTEEHLGFLSGIVKLYRGEALEGPDLENSLLKSTFPDGTYRDVAGLCKRATLEDIAAQGHSLNPGRYVGVTEKPADDFVFAEKLEELNEELEALNIEARALEEKIAENVAQLLEVMV